MKLKNVPINQVENWDKNPRGCKKEGFERLKKQIQKLGVYKPLLVYEDKGTYITLGGNMRLRAIKELKYKNVDISIIEPKTEAEKLEYALSDNDRIGYYEEQALAEMIVEFKDSINLENFKVDMQEPIGLDEILRSAGIGGEVIEDEVPEPPKIAKTKKGDLYILGNHRLLCGDSTLKADIDRLMNGQKADMVFTDPPYALFGNSTGVAGVTDDKMVRPFFLAIFSMMVMNVKLFGHCYTCCDWHSAFSLQAMGRESGLTEKNLCIWDKGDGGVGAMYQQCYEMVWFHANSPRATKTLGQKKSGERTVNGKPNIWRYSRVTGDRQHNAQKPTEMINNAIQNSTDEKGKVLDLFGGSGSTLIACEQTNRKCFMMELDPIYCDVIVERWENFTNMKAKKT